MCDCSRYSRLLPVLLLILWGCATSRSNTPGPSADALAVTQSIDSFIKYMEGQGLTLRLDGRPARPYFSVDTQQFRVSGDESVRGLLEVYQFASQSEARQSLGRIEVERGAFPGVDFYVQNKLVVVYYGNDPDVDAALAAVLRPM